MWIRCVSLSSFLLLALGSAIASGTARKAIAFFRPPSLLTNSVAQALGGQQDKTHDEFKFMEQLDLTTAQKQKLKAIYYQNKDRLLQRKQAVRQVTQELRDLMVGTASTDQVRTKYKQVEVVRQQLEAESFESMLATREVLTPIQRSQFAQLMEQQGKISYSRMVQQRGY
jgi:protein CpxP